MLEGKKKKKWVEEKYQKRCEGRGKNYENLMNTPKEIFQFLQFRTPSAFHLKNLPY